MDQREKKAIENYKNGCNCAQSVILAFTDELGMDDVQVRRLMEAFGGGFGGMQEVCGAFSGACAVIGYLNSDGSENAGTKQDTYKKVRKLADKFKDKYNSIICYEILNGNKPVHLKCATKITDAVKLTEEFIKTTNAPE